MSTQNSFSRPFHFMHDLNEQQSDVKMREKLAFGKLKLLLCWFVLTKTPPSTHPLALSLAHKTKFTQNSVHLKSTDSEWHRHSRWHTLYALYAPRPEHTHTPWNPHTRLLPPALCIVLKRRRKTHQIWNNQSTIPLRNGIFSSLEHRRSEDKEKRRKWRRRWISSCLYLHDECQFQLLY